MATVGIKGLNPETINNGHMTSAEHLAVIVETED